MIILVRDILIMLAVKNDLECDNWRITFVKNIRKFCLARKERALFSRFTYNSNRKSLLPFENPIGWWSIQISILQCETSDRLSDYREFSLNIVIANHWYLPSVMSCDDRMNWFVWVGVNVKSRNGCRKSDLFKEETAEGEFNRIVNFKRFVVDDEFF